MRESVTYQALLRESGISELEDDTYHHKSVQDLRDGFGRNTFGQ